MQGKEDAAVVGAWLCCAADEARQCTFVCIWPGNLQPPSSGSRKNKFASGVPADVRVSQAQFRRLRSHSPSVDHDNTIFAKFDDGYRPPNALSARIIQFIHVYPSI